MNTGNPAIKLTRDAVEQAIFGATRDVADDADYWAAIGATFYATTGATISTTYGATNDLTGGNHEHR